MVDVSNPDRLIEQGFYDNLLAPSGVAVDGEYMYVADERGGLYILLFGVHQVHLPLVRRY